MIKLSFNLNVHLHWGEMFRRKSKTPKCDRLLATVLNETLGQLDSVRGKSTMDNYRTAVRSFLGYAGEKTQIDNFNQQLVEGYQVWLQDMGVSMNTISCYMRSLRSLLTHSGVAGTNRDCFKSVFVGKTKTDKRSIPLEYIRRLHDLALPDGSKLQFARDLFLFSFYALGMPFVDLSFMRKTNIKDGYIVYRRHKTRQLVKVKIEPPMQSIISRYYLAQSPYVFPILSAEKHRQAYREYERARTSYNYYLHRLSLCAKLPCNLTSYVVRHSWATQAYKSNVELSVISKALGHSSPTTTLIYIREIDDYRIENANHKIIRQLETMKTKIIG